MKKYILYILTGVAACGLCSCEDALDRYPKDRLTPDNFFHTEEECQLYTNDFYTMFPSAGTIYGETADIIAKTTLTSEVLGNRTVPATAGSWKWEKLRDINFFLQYSSNCADEHVRLEYEGVARFFRAWFYFEKVKHYGDVPWVETIQKPFLLSFSRDPKIEVLGNIIKDLEFAKTYLPDNPDNVKEGKLTTWAARHLLSEMYLLRGAEGDYKLAEENAQDVIDCPYYSLMKSRFGNAKNDPGDYFSDMFVENNQNRSAGNTEGIWVQHGRRRHEFRRLDPPRLESPVPRHRRIRTGRLARRPRPGADLSAEVVDRRQGNQRHDGRRKGGFPRYSGKRHLRRRRHPQLGVQHQAQLVLQQPADAQQAGTKMPHRRQIVVAGPALPGAEEIFLR